MRILRYIMFAVLMGLAGCSRSTNESAPSLAPPATSQQTVIVRMVNPNLHLGHNILADQSHSIWRDGWNTELVGSGERLTVWGDGSEINNHSFTIQTGSTYTIVFTGSMATSGVFACEGKSLHIQQIADIKETE